MNKIQILDLVIQALEKEESVLIQAALTAKTAATEVEAKPENKYDTRGLEQSYLADGQSKRTQELQRSIHYLKTLNLHAFDKSSKIEISALVEILSEEGEKKLYFMLPERGGIKIRAELNGQERDIFTISPDSPLGEAMFGKKVGAMVELVAGGQARSYEIVDLS